MKKFAKVTLITALICLVLGIIICMVVGLNKGFQFLNQTDNWWNGKKKGSYYTEDFDKVFSENITALDIELDFGELKIYPGDGFRVIGTDILENTMNISVNSSGVLSIHQDSDNKWFDWTPGHMNVPHQKLEITVPKDVYLDFFNMNNGLSESDIRGIRTERAEFSFGAGENRLSDFIADEVTIDGGVGDTHCNNVKFNDITMDVGVGNMSIKGEVTGDCDIDTGVGDFDMEIIGNPDDYYFDVDAGVGDITIDGSHVSGRFGNSRADNKIDIDAGVGGVDVSFIEKGADTDNDKFEADITGNINGYEFSINTNE